MSVEFNANCDVGGERVLAQLFYSDDDPAIVQATFFQGNNPEWLIGRELFKEVLDNGHAGLGDVTLHDHGDVVKIKLVSHQGEGFALFERAVIEEFVAMIYDEVAEGEDSYEFPDEVYEQWLEVWSE